MFDIITFLGFLTLTINVVLYTIFFKRNSFAAYRYITIYSWSMLIIQFVSLYYNLNKMDNIFISHFYFIIQFILISLFYRSLLSKQLGKIINAAMVVILGGLTLQYFLEPALFSKFNILEILLCSLSLVIYATMYLYSSLDKEKRPWILLTSGLIIYLLSSSIVFTGGNYFIEEIVNKIVSFKYNFWLINSVIYVVYQLLITVEWYKNFKKPVLKR